MSANEISRSRALAFLGKNWVLHPDYRFNPRHSLDAGVYQPARAKYLREVAESARVSRERNVAALLQQIEIEKAHAEIAHQRYLKFRLVSA